MEFIDGSSHTATTRANARAGAGGLLGHAHQPHPALHVTSWGLFFSCVPFRVACVTCVSCVSCVSCRVYCVSCGASTHRLGAGDSQVHSTGSPRTRHPPQGSGSASSDGRWFQCQHAAGAHHYTPSQQLSLTHTTHTTATHARATKALRPADGEGTSSCFCPSVTSRYATKTTLWTCKATCELHDRSQLSVPDLLHLMIMVISSLPPRLGSVLAAHEYAEFPLAIDAGDEVRHGTYGSVAVQVVEQVLDVLDRRVLCLVDTPIRGCHDMNELRRRRGRR